MIAPHLLEYSAQVSLNLVREAVMQESRQSFLVGLHTRWQPQRGSLDIANEVGCAACKGSATQGDDKIRKVPQLAFGSGVHPAIGGVVAEGENKRGDKAGLIAISCCLNLRFWSRSREVGMERVLGGFLLARHHQCLRRGRNPVTINGDLISPERERRREEGHRAVSPG
jgi:hypothetical protein